MINKNVFINKLLCFMWKCQPVADKNNWIILSTGRVYVRKCKHCGARK